MTDLTNYLKALTLKKQTASQTINSKRTESLLSQYRTYSDIRNIRANKETSYIRGLSSLSEKVSGHVFTSEDIQKINERSPRTSLEAKISEGIFIVNGVWNQDDKVFKVELKDVSTDEKINAVYEPNSVLASQKMTFNKFASELAGKKINGVLYTKTTKTTRTTILTDWELIDDVTDIESQAE